MPHDRSPRRYNDDQERGRRGRESSPPRVPTYRRSRSRSPVNKRRKYSRSTSRDGRRSDSRDRRRSTSRDRRKREGRSRRNRSSSSSSASSVDKKKKKRRKDSKERRERKERKREKKERKKKKAGAVPQWGKYGIISEIEYGLSAPRRSIICSPKLSIFSKGPEFHTWLVEERKINPETISKDQSKKEFARFVEDFNTATLPHEKYYNMEAYERRMSALRSGEFVPPSDDTYDPQADMKAISGAHKKKLVEHESYMSREQLMELRKVQNERIEAGKMKLLGMDIKTNMGVRMDGTAFE
ncbi:hypothetical protein EDD18DRAFT_1255699 [Armillaria luteobubalina]|uniref:Uncharacterized protein n=1 Tax=Armillaria luteobubalina TaxID=153913 RepID=A0AA39UVT1_9AGAR|nr:hypothetical protein EDD18DRAFT_1255699 [Armillaria luteobubalina]